MCRVLFTSVTSVLCASVTRRVGDLFQINEKKYHVKDVIIIKGSAKIVDNYYFQLNMQRALIYINLSNN